MNNDKKLTYAQKNKIAVATLACFLVAFVAAYALKILGIFIFEKALDWQIFKIIDENRFLLIAFYTVLTFGIMYCLTFAPSGKLYSKIWWHYVILAATSIGTVLGRLYFVPVPQAHFIYDIIAYIGIPIIFNIFIFKTIDKMVAIVTSIFLYFCFAGMTDWSNMLNELLDIYITNPPASTYMLIYTEVLIGLGLILLSGNYAINYLKEEMKYGSKL